MVRALIVVLLFTPLLRTPTGAQEPPPDSVRAVQEVLASFTRAALAAPESPGTWTGLTAALGKLRPEGAEEDATAAERLARAYADSVLASSSPLVYRIQLRNWNEGTELRIETSRGVSYRTGRIPDNPERQFYVDLLGTSVELPAAEFRGLDRGGVASIDVVETDGGDARVIVTLSESLVYRIDREDDAVLARFWSGDSMFEPWTSDAVIAARNPDPIQSPAGRVAEPQETRSDPASASLETAAQADSPGGAILEGMQVGLATLWTLANRGVVQARLGISAGWRRLEGSGLPLNALGLLLSALVGILSAWVVSRRRKGVAASPPPPTRDELAPYARRLLTSGASPPDVARQTGMSRDGLAFVEFMASQADAGPALPGGSSAPGNNARARTPA